MVKLLLLKIKVSLHAYLLAMILEIFALLQTTLTTKPSKVLTK